MEKLIVLGTGNASSDNFYNTCFALCDGQTPVLVDAGGGNGVFLQMRKIGLAPKVFHHTFLSHCYTEDSHANDRKKLHTKEARKSFRGFLAVPNDLETIGLSS